MSLLYISILQLTYYKIFIGHSILNTKLLSSWLIFNLRGKTTILNLFNTIKTLKMSYILIKQLINASLPLWFINFDLTKENIIKKNAFKAGEFYLTRKWIRGLISNYFVITKAFRKFLIKKEFVRVTNVEDIYNKWFFTRFTWPRVIFISNVTSSFIVSKEAASSKVASIALVDSNVKTFLYNLPISSNFESINSVGFMNSLIAYYIIQCKYKKVLIWYYFNRNIIRYNTFMKWLNKLVFLKKTNLYKIKLKKLKIPNYTNYFSDIKKGLNLFFSRNYKFKLFNKKNVETINYNNFDFFYNRNKFFLKNLIKAFNYKRSSYKYRIKYKRYFFSEKIEGVSLFKSFLNNFSKLKDSMNRFRYYKNKKKNILKKKK